MKNCRTCKYKSYDQPEKCDGCDPDFVKWEPKPASPRSTDYEPKLTEATSAHYICKVCNIGVAMGRVAMGKDCTVCATHVVTSDGKNDAGKLRYDLITPAMLEGLARVLTHGAEEYGSNTWQKLPDAKSRYIAAEMRHFHAGWRKGEKLDKKTGIPHFYHAAINLLFLAELD